MSDSRIFPNCELVGIEPRFVYCGHLESKYFIPCETGKKNGFEYSIGYLPEHHEYFVQWWYASSIAHTSLVATQKYVCFERPDRNFVLVLGSQIRGMQILADFMVRQYYTQVFYFQDENITVKFGRSVVNPSLFVIDYKDNCWRSFSTLYTASNPDELERLQNILKSRSIPEVINQSIYDGVYVPQYVQFTESLAIHLFLNWIE